jgi:AraC family transcriptional regulator
MSSDRALLRLLCDIRARVESAPTLKTLSARTGSSPFQLHRAFRAMVGESPKQYTLRLRLEQAATRLATRDASVLEIALGAGFKSHEVFTRAFSRHFGMTPTAYRASALPDASPAIRDQHTSLVESAGPCIGLYHLRIDSPSRRAHMPTLSIERRDMPAQPFLFVQSRVARSEIAKAIAEGLGKVFPYAMKAGLPMAGRPTARYLTSGPGLLDMQVGVPMAVAAPGQGDVQAGELPGGSIAVAVHAGAYEQLGDTYAEMERWMDANRYRRGDAPWESYVTDPGEVPDVKDWRTEIYWPLEK